MFIEMFMRISFPLVSVENFIEQSQNVPPFPFYLLKGEKQKRKDSIFRD